MIAKVPNHKLFDPENENQREAYFYSLILLFTPFKYESDLLLENKTAEEAFHRVVNLCVAGLPMEEHVTMQG